MIASHNKAHQQGPAGLRHICVRAVLLSGALQLGFAWGAVCLYTALRQRRSWLRTLFHCGDVQLWCHQDRVLRKGPALSQTNAVRLLGHARVPRHCRKQRFHMTY